MRADQIQRYARNIALAELGESGQEKLLSARVLVIGAGALGGASLAYLSAAGAGVIGVADFDKVELSNLQRQIIHGVDVLGEYKTVSAASFIRRLNPGVEVHIHTEKVTADNILPLIADYDFVLDCTDRFGVKLLINDACVIAGKPFSHAGVLRFGGQAMTYVPGRGACLRCLLGGVPADGDGKTAVSAGVLGAVAGMLGTVQATEAVKYITGAGKLLTGRILSINALDWKVRVTDIPSPDPDCAVCGAHPTITSLKENEGEYFPR